MSWLRRQWRRMLVRVMVAVLALGLGYVGCAFAVNRWRWAPTADDVDIEPAGTPGSLAVLPALRADAPLRIMTWNVGYAGMGAESDFIADGGAQYRPRSLDLVNKNLDGIRAVLNANPVEIYALQEAAGRSWFTYRVDVVGALAAALPGTAWTFGDDFATRLIPPPWSTSIGNATFARVATAAASRRRLPMEPTYVLGTFRKLYRMHITEHPVAGVDARLVLINIHVAAFDENAQIRTAQIAEVLRYARERYEGGDAVIVAGDLNLRLVSTEFPHATESRHLFWVHDWPRELLPAGWTLAADASRPTNRTAQQPYVAGENYTSVIDGFICSPNVTVRKVEVVDQGFAFSDHNPVILEAQVNPTPRTPRGAPPSPADTAPPRP